MPSKASEAVWISSTVSLNQQPRRLAVAPLFEFIPWVILDWVQKEGEKIAGKENDNLQVVTYVEIGDNTLKGVNL